MHNGCVAKRSGLREVIQKGQTAEYLQFRRGVCNDKVDLLWGCHLKRVVRKGRTAVSTQGFGVACSDATTHAPCCPSTSETSGFHTAEVGNYVHMRSVLATHTNSVLLEKGKTWNCSTAKCLPTLLNIYLKKAWTQKKDAIPHVDCPNLKASQRNLCSMGQDVSGQKQLNATPRGTPGWGRRRSRCQAYKYINKRKNMLETVEVFQIKITHNHITTGHWIDSMFITLQTTLQYFLKSSQGTKPRMHL